MDIVVLLLCLTAWPVLETTHASSHPGYVTVSSTENVRVVRGVSLQYHTKRLSWKDARETCRSDSDYPMLLQSLHTQYSTQTLKEKDFPPPNNQINANRVWIGLSSEAKWTHEYVCSVTNKPLLSVDLKLYLNAVTAATHVTYPPCLLRGLSISAVDCKEHRDVICIDGNGGWSVSRNLTWEMARDVCHNQSAMMLTLSMTVSYIETNFPSNIPDYGNKPKWSTGYWMAGVKRQSSNTGFLWSHYGAATWEEVNKIQGLAATVREPGLCVAGLGLVTLAVCDEQRDFICVNEHEMDDIVATAITLYSEPDTMANALKGCATVEASIPERFDPRLQTTQAGVEIIQLAIQNSVSVGHLWSGLMTSSSWTHTYSWSMGGTLTDIILASYQPKITLYNETYPPCLCGFPSSPGVYDTVKAVECDDIHDTVCSDKATIVYNVTWSQAAAACKNNGAGLYTLDSDSPLVDAKVMDYLRSLGASLHLNNVWLDKVIRRSHNPGFVWLTQGPASVEEVNQLSKAAEIEKEPGKCVYGYNQMTPAKCNELRNFWCVNETSLGVNMSSVSTYPPLLTIQNYKIHNIPIIRIDLEVKPNLKLTTWEGAHSTCSSLTPGLVLPQGNHKKELLAIFSRAPAKEYIQKNSFTVERSWSGLRSYEPWIHEYSWQCSGRLLSKATVGWYSEAVKADTSVPYPSCVKGIRTNTAVVVNCTDRAAVVCMVVTECNTNQLIASSSSNTTCYNHTTRPNLTWVAGARFCDDSGGVMVNLDVRMDSGLLETMRTSNISVDDVWSDRVSRVSSNKNYTWRGSHLTPTHQQLDQFNQSVATQAEPGLCAEGIKQLSAASCDKLTTFICVKDTRVTIHKVEVNARLLSWNKSKSVCKSSSGYMLPLAIHTQRLKAQLVANGDPQNVGGRGVNLDNMWLGLKSDAEWTFNYTWSLSGQLLSNSSLEIYKRELTHDGKLHMCIQGGGNLSRLVNCSHIGDALCRDRGTGINAAYTLSHNVAWLEARKICQDNTTDLLNLDELEQLEASISQFFVGSSISFRAEMTWLDRVVRASHNPGFRWSDGRPASREVTERLEVLGNSRLKPGKCVAGFRDMTLHSCDERLYFACVNNSDTSESVNIWAPYSPGIPKTPNPTTGISCTCTGGCPADPTQWTDEVKKRVVDEILTKLTINKSTVSATVRKYTSAEDDRPSATAMGGLGIGMLITVFGGLIVLDLPMIFEIGRTILANFGQLWLRLRRPPDVIYLTE